MQHQQNLAYWFKILPIVQCLQGSQNCIVVDLVNQQID